MRGSRKKIHAFDFFCGCGGTSAGLRAAGIKIVFALDNDADAGQTYRTNFPKTAFVDKDIRLFSVNQFKRYVKRSKDNPILFSACAPCQPFSKQNRHKRRNDVRKPLLLEITAYLEAIKPDYIFLENVPEMRKRGGARGPFTDFISVLETNDYFYDQGVVASRDYGAPQLRKRLVLVASRHGPIEFPPATHGPGTKKPAFVTVRDAIKHLPPIKAGEEHSSVKNHRAAALSALNLDRIRATPEGGDRRDWDASLAVPCHKTYGGHTDVYGRLRWNKPAPALTTRCISYSNGRYGHPEQDRAISVREAANLQTFPEDFVFEGNLNSMARQIGNAVPVTLAQVFGEHIVRHHASAAI